MKFKNLLISVLILIIILVGGYILFGKMQTQVQPSKDIQYSPSSSVEKVFRYDCQPNKTAFDVLDENFEVEFTESSFGKLVTSIEGKSQGDGKYWLYSIDDKEATMGATTYICKGDEKIKWELK